MTRTTAVVAALLLLGTATGRADEFPLPPALEPDVGFWLSIFTRHGDDVGVLHDNRSLGVVYEIIDMPARTPRSERNRRVAAKREAIRAALTTLASGRRDGLDEIERRVLAVWGDDVDADTLRAAAGRIRYQQGLAGRFRDGLERAGRWRSHIEAEFARLGVPADLAALPHVESSYDPNARSHVGASGIWQFTRSTGRRFMRVDHVVDERNDPYRASTAAGQLLAYNHSIAGNWPLAITAYNHGLSGVRRAQRQFGDEAYVDILRRYRGRTFGFASRNFYVAFLAAREVDLNVDDYFPGLTPDPPMRLALARLPDYIAADALSTALGVSPAQLAAHNPALQATVWQGSKLLPRDFPLRLPPNLIDTPLDTAFAGIDTWQAQQLPDLFHTVVRGDTLSGIAATYDTSVGTLVALNGLTSRHRIRAGQQLRLPAAGPAPAAVAAVESAVVDALADSGEVVAVTEAEPAALGGDAEPAAAVASTDLLSDPSDYSVAGDGTIEVHPQETLGHFADWLGIRTQRLRDANALAFRDPVEVGDRLRLVFDDIDGTEFEARRIAWHRAAQDAYFRRHVISGIREHVVAPGESVWVLALRRYDVPIWLFRQYNPGLDLHSVRPGTVLQFPVLSAADGS